MDKSENIEYKSTAERELAESGIYATNTVGHSMEPFLSHHRDVVVIARPESEPKRFDVVLYAGKDDSYVLHRIILVRDDCYVIRGDNNYFTERVPKDKILGVLVSFTRKGRRGSVKDFGYRLYSRIRCATYPIRALVRKIRTALGRAYRAIFKR